MCRLYVFQYTQKSNSNAPGTRKTRHKRVIEVFLAIEF